MNDLLDGAGPLRLKKCRRGYMLNSINDMTIGRSLDLYGEFSEQEAAIFEHLIRPGNVVVEAGANIGSHTVALARFVGPNGRVVAFEPQTILFQNLCANVALNGFTNVETVHAAVGNIAERLELPKIDYDKPGLFGANAIGGDASGGTDCGGVVSCVRLDDCLHLDRCNLIKIDVEGMELDVLKGARGLIDKFKPVLYVENDRRDKSEALIDYILNLDYSLYWHLPPLFQHPNFFGDNKNVFPGLISINMLCVPAGTNVSGLENKKITSPQDWWENLPATAL